MRRVEAGIVAVAAALAVGGCGGGGGGTTQAPGTTATAPPVPRPAGAHHRTNGRPPTLGSREAMREATVAVLASSDPARACRRFASASYLRHAYGGREACVRAQSPGSAARSLRSFRVVQEGGGGAAATVQAVPNGGPYSGHKVDVGLAYRSGRYVVASLHARVPVGP